MLLACGTMSSSRLFATQRSVDIVALWARRNLVLPIEAIVQSESKSDESVVANVHGESETESDESVVVANVVQS